MKDKVLVLGASSNAERFSNKAIALLKKNGKIVRAIGARDGHAHDVEIHKKADHYGDIDTVSMYLAPKNQHDYYDYIISLEPRRVIFNPGTENEEFAQRLRNSDIEVVEDCTLVMLNSKTF